MLFLNLTPNIYTSLHVHDATPHMHPVDYLNSWEDMNLSHEPKNENHIPLESFGMREG